MSGVDRKTVSAVAKFVVCLCGIIYAIYHAPAPTGECPDGYQITSAMLERAAFERIQVHRGECFFPANYEDGAKRFVAAATSAGAEMTSMPVGLDGLKTDVAIFRRGADPKKFIVHLSGTHGPEGYVGSAVQNAALQYIKANGLYQQDAANTANREEVALDAEGSPVDTPQSSSTNVSLLPTLVFVHAVNPYGFKHHRRVNEDNVDLNRNFLSDAEWTQVQALDPNYARHIDFKDIINPTSMPFPFIWMNDLYQLVRSAVLMLQYGKNSIKTALVSGNYINPTGYSYGGKTHTQSARNLIDLLVNQLDLPHLAEKLVLIDVHSGLGPSGVDTLLDVGFSPALVESVFPTEYNIKGEAIGALKTSITPPAVVAATAAGSESSKLDGSSAATAAAAQAAVADEVSKGYEMVKGVITGGFCNDTVAPQLGGKDKLCVTQEFGTLDVTTVGMTLIAENYAHFHGTDAEKKHYSEKLKGCFFVQTKDWKRRTLHRGMMLFLQAMDHLSN